MRALSYPLCGIGTEFAAAAVLATAPTATDAANPAVNLLAILLLVFGFPELSAHLKLCCTNESSKRVCEKQWPRTCPLRSHVRRLRVLGEIFSPLLTPPRYCEASTSRSKVQVLDNLLWPAILVLRSTLGNYLVGYLLSRLPFGHNPQSPRRLSENVFCEGLNLRWGWLRK